MARTIDEIYNEIITSVTGDERLANLNSPSKTAIWRLYSYVVAVSIWSLEKLTDLHMAEVDKRILELKPHTARWYRSKALAFQYGFQLVQETDKYDNTGVDDTVIENSLIIKYAAVTESDDESRLVIKIATEENGVLAPISVAESDAFTAYIKRIRDAGVKTTIINFLPDRLFLNLDIYYDPLVLDGEGNNILSGGKTVEEAINAYMKELPFNGQLVLAHLVDRLQQVQGVDIPHINLAETSWIDAEINDYGDAQPITVKQIPVSGYFAVANFDNVNYIANV